MFGDDLTDRQLIDLTEQLDPSAMRPHEDKFLHNIQNSIALSPKQRSWLLSILETHGVLEVPVGGRVAQKQTRPEPPPRETKLTGFSQPRVAHALPPGRLGGVPAAATRSPTFNEALDEIDPCQGGGYGADPLDPYEPDF